MGLTLWIALGVFILYRLSLIIYNIFFHPLRAIPGPWYYHASWLPKYYRTAYCGNYWHRVKEFHDKYGPVVRVGPSEISCTTVQAWDDIYGSKPMYKLEFPKDPIFYDVRDTPLNASMVSADKATHRAMRRQVAPAFSDKALREQEFVVQEYADLFISQLRARIDTPIDIVSWFTFATSDTIADLSTGESLNCLASGKMDPFVEMIFNVSPFIGLIQLFNRLPIMKFLYKSITSQKGLKTWLETVDIVQAKANRRGELGNDRPDFMSLIWAENGDRESWTQDKITNFAQLLFFAGSETSATALSAIIYWVLIQEGVYKKLVAEIRGIEKVEEITLDRLKGMEYLGACIEEGMRMRPPVAAVVPRVAPEGGDFVDGYFVPEGTTVGVSQWATNHMESNFKDPHEFCPERWLGDEYFKDDKRDAFQPFAKGPRNCLGKRVAYAQMKILLAKLLWNFDVELREGQIGWDTRPSHQSVVFWHKPPLLVKLVPVVR